MVLGAASCSPPPRPRSTPRGSSGPGLARPSQGGRRGGAAPVRYPVGRSRAEWSPRPKRSCGL